MALKNGRVRTLLGRLGVDVHAVRTEIERFVGAGPAERPLADSLPLTPRAQRALAIAASEARAQRHETVAAEFIFLGLLIEGSGVAAVVLKRLGVDLPRVREEIARELGGNPGQP